MIAECYDLSVQCDNETHVIPVRSSFNGPNRRYCWAQAKRAGWALLKDGSAKCPRCASGKHSMAVYRVNLLKSNRHPCAAFDGRTEGAKVNSDNTPAKVGSMKGLGAVVEALCMCKDRALSACPGEWESGCDLGNNPKYVRVVEASRDEPTPALDCPAHGREAQRQQHEYDNRMDRARELLMRCDDGFGAYIMGRRMARKERDKLRGDIRKWLDA